MTTTSSTSPPSRGGDGRLARQARIVTVGPPWWEVGLRLADLTAMVPTGFDVAERGGEFVWRGQKRPGVPHVISAADKVDDQEAYAKLRELPLRWGGTAAQPFWATVAERTSTSWILLRQPRGWVMFEHGVQGWVEVQERRPCPRPTPYDIWTTEVDTPERVGRREQGEGLDRINRHVRPIP